MTQLTQALVNGSVSLAQSRGALASQGKYYLVTNPTPGTGITYAAQTTYSATANGLFSISNGNPSGSGVNLYLDYLDLIQTQTGLGSCLNMRFEVNVQQTVAAITTNVVALTPVNVNSAFANTSQATVTAFTGGAATVPATVASRRQVAVVNLPTSAAIRYSTYGLVFGSVADLGPHSNGAGLTGAAATAPYRIATACGPVVVAPQNTAFINMWWNATDTAPIFEFQFGFAEA